MATTAETLPKPAKQRPSSANKISSKSKKGGKVVQKIPAEETKAPEKKKDIKELTAEQAQLKAQKEEERRKQELEHQAKVAELNEKKRLILDMTTHEIEQIKEQHNYNLESKNIFPNQEVTSYHKLTNYDYNKSQRRNCENFMLRPDPIMALDRVTGLHPRFNPGQVYFNKDPKLASELLFCQANLMLGYHATL
jgi:hypothetical protein